MTTKILSAVEIRKVELSTLPMGDFEGVWGGYEATVEIDGVKYEFKTEDGIRTPATRCLIHIKNGEATIEAA